MSNFILRKLLTMSGLSQCHPRWIAKNMWSVCIPRWTAISDQLIWGEFWQAIDEISQCPWISFHDEVLKHDPLTTESVHIHIMHECSSAYHEIEHSHNNHNFINSRWVHEVDSHGIANVKVSWGLTFLTLLLVMLGSQMVNMGCKYMIYHRW